MSAHELLHAAELAARSAGALLRAREQKLVVSEKGRFDLVSSADRAAQELIETILRQHFPDFAFLGEEDSQRTDSAAGSPCDSPLWVVDPLDGTTNYVHGYPAYSVSIGLIEQGAATLGVIYDPERDELFAAAQGLGATLNGRPIECSRVDALGQALLAVGFPSDLRGKEETLEHWRRFTLEAQGLRRTGSSALNLAYIAAGRLDGFAGFHQHPWDVAAGMVIVQEAGGQVTRIDGSSYDVLQPGSLAASNGPLQQELLRCLASSLPPLAP
jgi:myo-inositol-1(or 4)-monophosphatase